MKRVLVIGANSYIGMKFKEYILQIGEKDITVDLVSALDGRWRQVDLSIYDVVLHLAAIVHIKESKDLEKIFYDINHKLALEVAKKAKDAYVKQFIFMSTASVFGLRTGCITKDIVPNPVTFYGKSKLLAERDIMKLYNEDFRIAIVRPPIVYGKECRGNYARLVKLAKYTLIFPEYHNKRSMLHIDTLSKYLAQLIKNGSSGYFHPQEAEYADICKMIVRMREETGKKTILVSFFNNLISFMVKKEIGIFQKIFGDLYYDRELV